jgi:hypothetical protein
MAYIAKQCDLHGSRGCKLEKNLMTTTLGRVQLFQVFSVM